MKFFFKALIAVCTVLFLMSLSFPMAAAVPFTVGQVQNKAEIVLSGLKAAATGYCETGQNYPSGMARGDFDEFNNINDPLSREGSKAFLRANFLKDEAGKTAKAPVLRNALSDTGDITVEKKQSSCQKNKPVIKKCKAVKFLRVDPLKSKNII